MQCHFSKCWKIPLKLDSWNLFSWIKLSHESYWVVWNVKTWIDSYESSRESTILPTIFIAISWKRFLDLFSLSKSFWLLLRIICLFWFHLQLLKKKHDMQSRKNLLCRLNIGLFLSAVTSLSLSFSILFCNCYLWISVFVILNWND